MATSKFQERENKRKSVVTGILNEVPEKEPEPATPSSNIFVVPKVKQETRSRRVNFLVKPSVHEKAIEKCDAIGISFSECINQLLEGWVKQ